MKLKNILLIGFILIVALTFNGCNFKSTFTPLEDVAIDKKYIPTQCNTYDHEFNIIGKKYSTNENDQITYIIIPLSDLTLTLTRYNEAKTIFNETIRETNKAKIVKDPNTNASKRIEEIIYIERECPTFDYIPEFKAKKLTETFKPSKYITYVLIQLPKFMIELEKSKTYRETYNNGLKTKQ